MNKSGDAVFQWSKMKMDVASDEEAGVVPRKEKRGRRSEDPAASKSLRSLRLVDLIPCTYCGLRGHVAGDPDRCIQPISLRLGEMQSPQGSMKGVGRR